MLLRVFDADKNLIVWREKEAGKPGCWIKANLNEKKTKEKGHINNEVSTHAIHNFYISIRGKIDSSNDLVKLVENLILESF